MNNYTIYIITTLGIGDAHSNRIIAYANALVQKGKKVKIISLSYNKGKISTLDPSIHIIYLQNKPIKSRLLKFITNAIKLALVTKREIHKEDCIYVYSLIDYLPIIYFLKKRNLFHEMTECPEILRSHLPRNIYYNTCKNLSGIFVITKGLKELFIKKGIEKNKVHIINMIVDSKRFNNIQEKKVSEEYIAYCGTAGNKKDGVDKLLRIFFKYHQIYPNKKIYIIGPFYNKETEIYYRQYVSDNKLDNNVIFWGLVPQDQIPRLLLGAEMLLLTRPNNLQAKYGFPTKLGEYLLTKKPVVITKVGEIEFFLKDHENAMLASPENEDEFLEKMIYLTRYPNEAKKIGINGYETAITYFNSIKEVDKIIAQLP